MSLMCNPAAIAGASVIMAGGQILGGIQQRNAANASAKIDRYNAGLKRDAANVSLQKGAEESSDIRERLRAVNATTNAIIGGSGVQVGTGSALDILTNNAVGAQADIDKTNFNSAYEAWGLNMDALNLENQARQKKAQGRNAFTSSLISAGGTVLSGFGTAADSAAKSGSWWSSTPATP